MASQEEEAVPVVAAPGGVEPDEEVKQVGSRGGEFSVNGAPVNHSFNSRISTDVDLAESQVAVAGSVDSAAEVSAVGAGVEEPSARVDHHAGPASSGEVVDATEKVESWDLSEAVQEGTASKEDSKPNFSEDGTAEEIRSSDLIADAPTSASSVEDSAAADVEEKTGEGRSDEDVGGGREVVSPAEVVVTEDGSPKVQDEGSAEKGESEVTEVSAEGVHKVGEATTSAEPEKGVSVEVVPSLSADAEAKAVDVEDEPVNVANKSVDAEDIPVDVADKSVEVKSVSEELPAEPPASEEGSPKILDQGSTGKGASEAPESPVEEINEIARPTAVEPDEGVASLEALPSLSADVEDKPADVEDKPADVQDKPVDVEDKPVDVPVKPVDVEDKPVDAEDKPADVEDKPVDVPVEPVDAEDKPVDVEDKPVDVEDKPIDVADKSVDVGPQIVEMNSEDAGVVSEKLPAVVAASEEVSPKDEGSAEKGNIEAPEAPVEEVQDVAEATPRVESHELESLEALPSSPVDAEQISVDLNSADAGALSEDVSPIIKDEESAEKVANEATEVPVGKEVHEVASATSGAEPDEAGSNVEAVPSPSVDVEEKSVELDSADARGASEDVSPKINDEESAEKVANEATEVPVGKEVHEVASATSGAEPDEAGSNVEAVPSSSVDIEEKSVELDSAVARGVSEDVSPKINDEESAEKVANEATEVPVGKEVHEVASATSGAEPDEAGSNVEAVPSPSVDVEEKSVELDSADAGAVSEDVSPIIKDEESAEKVDSDPPEPLVEEVHEVASATSGAEPDEAGSNVEAVPSPSVDVEEKSVELDSADARGVSEDVSPKINDEESAEKVANEATEVPVGKEVHEVASATSGAEPDEAGSNVEAVPSPSVDVEEKSVELDSADARGVSEDVSPKINDEESAEKVDSDPPEPPAEEVHEITSDTKPDEAGSNVEAVPSPSVDVEEKSVELESADAGAVSEDVSPIIKDEDSADQVDREAPEVSVEEVREVAEPTSSAEPAEEVASLEVVPSPSADVEDRSVGTHFEDAGAVSEDVSPKIEDEKADSEAPDAPVEDEVHEPDEAVSNLETVPSSSVDEKSVELDSAGAEAVSEDVSPKIDAEESTEKFDSNAPEPLVEEVHEVTSDTKPDEAGSNVEAVPSPSVDIEEKSFEPDSADAGTVDEDVSPKIDDGESAEKVDSEAPEPLVEEVHEVAEATTGAEPAEEVASSIAVPSPSVDVEEKSFELDSAGAGAVTEDANPKIEDEESAEKVDIELPKAPVEDEVHEVAGATTSAKPVEAGSNVEAVPSPSVDFEEKSVELDSAGAGAVSEDISPKFEDEELADNGDKKAREAPVGEQVHEVAEASTSTEPDEANVEAVPSPSVDVEEKSFDLDSVDAGAVSEGVRPEMEAEGSAEKVDREAPEVPVEDAVHEPAEATSHAKPDEALSSVEFVSAPSVDVEDKSVELNSEDAVTVSEDVSPIIKDEESTEKVDSEAPEPHEVISPIINDGESTEKVDSEASEPHEVAEAIHGAEPAEEVSSSFSVPSPSVDVEEKSFELDHVDPTVSAEAHEETASQESGSARTEDVEDKSVQEADSKDTTEASEVLPPENTTDREDIRPEPLPEGNVGSQTLFFPDEEVHEVVEETISAEPGEVPVEPESALAPSDVEDRSVDSGDAIGVTTTAESVDKEGLSPERSSEATISADASLESEGSASLKSLSVPANNVEDRSLGVNPEDTSEAKIELDTENTIKDDLRPEFPAEGSTDDVRSADKEGLIPELPAEGSADNVGSESLFTSVEEVHEVIEETISPELDEGSTSLESGPASDDVEEKPEDLSEATTTAHPLESVDKELVSRDLPAEKLDAPVDEIEKFEDAATDEESTVLEYAVASSEDFQSVPETKSKEFNFKDLKESLTSSEKEETAIGEEGSSSDAVARDTTPLDVSSPLPAEEKRESPNSYDLHEEAVHLEEAAEKTLEDAKSGDKHASVAESVAQIVLDESSKTGDSSELISGVIQHVAQLAQDDFQSDPNVLPDTVNQVFDRESAGSPANDGSQPKESSSLGTKFSLFVIWCISLCASHVSSKDMPAPALKLGAEEVAAVLHSNSQGAASSKAASSV